VSTSSVIRTGDGAVMLPASRESELSCGGGGCCLQAVASSLLSLGCGCVAAGLTSVLCIVVVVFRPSVGLPVFRRARVPTYHPFPAGARCLGPAPTTQVLARVTGPHQAGSSNDSLYLTLVHVRSVFSLHLIHQHSNSRL
jgi:hypothetical protein